MNRSALAIAVLVALRLATGWHFFNEGVDKLDPAFEAESAGFLRGATGPLATQFRKMVTGPHNAARHLATPSEAGELSPTESVAEVGGPWLEDIAASWSSGLARVARLGASDDEIARAVALKDDLLEGLDTYIKDEADAVVALRHEVWRLGNMEAEASGDAAPFFQDRVKQKRAAIWGDLQPWFNAASIADKSFTDGVVEIVSDSVGDKRRVESALAERSPLRRINTLVMVVVLGSGILLFLGLCTPLAAVVAAGFLLSVMATQPPWVDGADTKYFFYQLVEVIALLLLAVTCAGRWAGLDRLVFGGSPAPVDNSADE